MVEREGEDLRHISLTAVSASSSATSSACTTPATGCRTAAADIAAARRSRSGHGCPARCPSASAASAASPAPTGLPRLRGRHRQQCYPRQHAHQAAGAERDDHALRAVGEQPAGCVNRGRQRNRHRQSGRLGQLVLIGLHQGRPGRDRGQQRRGVRVDERRSARARRQAGQGAVGVDRQPAREAAGEDYETGPAGQLGEAVGEQRPLRAGDLRSVLVVSGDGRVLRAERADGPAAAARAPDEAVRNCPSIKVGGDLGADQAAGESGDDHVVAGLVEQPRDVDGLAPGLGIYPADPVGLASGEALADIGDVEGGIQRGADDATAATRGHWPV